MIFGAGGSLGGRGSEDSLFSRSGARVFLSGRTLESVQKVGGRN